MEKRKINRRRKSNRKKRRIKIYFFIQHIKKIYKISILIFLTTALAWYSFANEENILSFTQYQKNLSTIDTMKTNISQTKLISKLKEIQDQECLIEEEWTNYILSPVCLLKKKLPTMDITEVWEEMKNNIYGFTNTYNETQTEFTYEWAIPLIKNIASVELFPRNNTYKAFLIYLQEQEKKIRIPKKIIAKELFSTYTFYVTKKDTTQLKPCTKQNYIVAFSSMDNIQIAPEETFTVNDHIAYLPGYCKGRWPQDLKFYGWVCWFATQVFRTSLLMPDIDIITRYAHSVWLVPYYSDYVFADDATIYENSKKLIIKNIGTETIYFKTIQKTNYTYLIAIIPQKNTKGVSITKKETSELAGEVTKNVYNIKKKNIINTAIFKAKYTSKAYQVQ